jgi:hypothetical protein
VRKISGLIAYPYLYVKKNNRSGNSYPQPKKKDI